MKKTGTDKSAKNKGVSAAEDSTKKSAGLGEIGDTGTQILQGIVNEEYNVKLRDVKGIEVYDEMRKSDGTVRATVLSTTLPIRRARWYIEPASQDESDVKIADFVSNALFDWQTIVWDDILRQALLMLPFGVMVFEKVFTTKNVDGKDYIIWQKLAPRLPKSIRAWQMTNGQDGIQQYKYTGETVDIPMEKLLVFVNEKEGENWWGTSILRAAYKHWYIKNNFYKIDSIAFERQGLGIPYANLPENPSESDREKAETILKNIRANHQAFVIVPSGYEIGFLDMKAGTLRDPSNSIAHHNREIAKSILAQFLELGATDSGSYALSEDQSGLFLHALEAIGNNICDVFNNYAIRQLVDLNFDMPEYYPKLRFTGITRVDVEKLANAYSSLTTSGGVRPGEADEVYFRELMGLPERDQSEDEDMPEDDITMSEHNHNHSHKHQKKKFKEGDFKSFRALTFAEKKVNFDGLQNKLDQLEAQFDKETKALLNDEREKFIAALTKAVNNEDRDAIKSATIKAKAAYAKIIKDSTRDAYEYGKTLASKEMGLSAPPSASAILTQIDIQADSIAEMHISEITNSAKTALTSSLSKGQSYAAAIAAADAAAQAAIDDLVSDTSGIVMSTYVNVGRDTVFETYSNKIYALQRSELLDSATCNYCLSVDGRVVEKDDPFAKNSIFHSGCRGIWVEILLDEEELPAIGGIPASVRDRFGDDVNDLIQPKTPITKKNSLARKEAERRLKRKAK